MFSSSSVPVWDPGRQIGKKNLKKQFPAEAPNTPKAKSKPFFEIQLLVVLKLSQNLYKN